ncbi:uncharacterized protein LOC129726981 [Wyeomyia smithii]|uniref:uncharacterized protein LOC129726981 n=1 Tax=Wyeomyia smithii TaxID=174621 RepID=UPI002467FEA8|nr:uncharacterized protein LOC129726981 [Wyeomyia smithii]
MKCIAAVVMMALAVVAEAGLAPLQYNYLYPYSGHTTVVQQTEAEPTKIIEAPLPVFYDYAAPYPYYPYARISQQPGAIYLLQKEARYLAANRGAAHDAPLPGHEYSQIQLNLEPAAGTI